MTRMVCCTGMALAGVLMATNCELAAQVSLGVSNRSQAAARTTSAPAVGRSTAYSGLVTTGSRNPEIIRPNHAAMNPHLQNVLSLYGTEQMAATLNKIPRPPAPPQTSQPLQLVRPPRTGAAMAQQRVPRKPFAATPMPPTVSPYLNLFRPDEDDGPPNYFTFVRPMLEQMDVNQQQQLEIQRLRRQLQQSPGGTGATQLDGHGMPTTGHGTRFLDLGGYYFQR